MSSNKKSRSFWRRPEGVTGGFVLAGVLVGGAFLVLNALPIIVAAMSNVVALSAMLIGVGLIIYMVLDSKTRNLFWYMYKSAMRWITGLFVEIDPIGVLKNYIADLRGNLKKMNVQINKLRQQMHMLQEQIINNKKAIKSNLQLASEAKQYEERATMILKSRKAGRLQDSNVKLEDLYRKMDILYKVLTRMYENSSIMLEDIEDQVKIKQQERQAIHASHSAMKSAMNIISGNADKRHMFDQALEAIADDVSNKVGEMERFMDMSENFMNSIDLQNGVFEEEGLKMLEKWETEGTSLLLGDEKNDLLLDQIKDDEIDSFDLDSERTEPLKATADPNRTNQYDSFFDE